MREPQEGDSGERLEELLLQGLDSGKDIDITSEYLEERNEAILAKVRQKKID